MTGGCQTVRALCQDDCELYVCLSERLFHGGGDGKEVNILRYQ